MIERPEALSVERDNAAEVLPGNGIVVHRRPLTIVISVAGDPAHVAPWAIAVVDELAERGDWTFGPVAEALQQFVVTNQPTGVAALLDVDPDPIAFLFDQARVTEPGETHHGAGRAGWNTVFVTGPEVLLSAGAENMDIDPVPGWSRLVAGTVAGSGVRVPIITALMATENGLETLSPGLDSEVVAPSTTPPPPAEASSVDAVGFDDSIFRPVPAADAAPVEQWEFTPNPGPTPTPTPTPAPTPTPPPAGTEQPSGNAAAGPRTGDDAPLLQTTDGPPGPHSLMEPAEEIVPAPPPSDPPETDPSPLEPDDGQAAPNATVEPPVPEASTEQSDAGTPTPTPVDAADEAPPPPADGQLPISDAPPPTPIFGAAPQPGPPPEEDLEPDSWTQPGRTPPPADTDPLGWSEPPSDITGDAAYPPDGPRPLEEVANDATDQPDHSEPFTWSPTDGTAPQTAEESLIDESVGVHGWPTETGLGAEAEASNPSGPPSPDHGAPIAAPPPWPDVAPLPHVEPATDGPISASALSADALSSKPDSPPLSDLPPPSPDSPALSDLPPPSPDSPALSDLPPPTFDSPRPSDLPAPNFDSAPSLGEPLVPLSGMPPMPPDAAAPEPDTPLTGAPPMPGQPPLTGAPPMPSQPPLTGAPPMPSQPPLTGAPPMPSQPPLTGAPPMPGELARRAPRPDDVDGRSTILDDVWATDPPITEPANRDESTNGSGRGSPSGSGHDADEPA